MSGTYLCFGGPRDGQWFEVQGRQLIVSRVAMSGGLGSDERACTQYQDGTYEVDGHPTEPCEVLQWKGWDAR